MNAFRITILLSLFLAAASSAGAQAVTTGAPRGATVYATYAVMPEFPLAKAHPFHAGVFALHLTAHGKVSAANIVKSTGNSEVDKSICTAFRKWRFQPPGQPTKVEIPIYFIKARGWPR